MAGLNCGSISFRANAQRLSVAQCAVLLSCIFAATTFCAKMQAAPITFRFDGQISRLSFGSPFDLPFEFQEGDTISGRFTFEPGPGVAVNDIAVGSDQTLPFEFNINGTHVFTSGYGIVAFDDSVDYDSERPPYDGLVLGCREASCAPDIVTLPDSKPFKVRWEMRLTGSSSTWSTPQIFGDVNLWNALVDERRIHVSFDNIALGSVGFDALVSSMSEVPEPALAGVLLVSAIHCSIHTRRRRYL